MTKVAIITGSTRGIGRKIALELAKNGYNITIAAKTIKSTDKLPGDIYSVSEEIKKIGMEALPFRLDLRDEKRIKECIKKTYDKWKRIDVLVNNAGALWWKNILETPAKRYDLINSVNSRGAYLMAREVIPYMIKNKGGHIINCSPPLTMNDNKTLAFGFNVFKGKIAYMISKLGMTISAIGIAEEYKNKGIAANTLWPLRPIESYALINHKLGNRKFWRKPDIISDSILEIVKEDPYLFSGNQLIDEIYLQSKGIKDFSKYNCVQGYTAPKLNNINHLWKAGKSKL